MEVFTIGLVIDKSRAADSVAMRGRGWSRFGRSHGNSDQLQTPGHREDAPAPVTRPIAAGLAESDRDGLVMCTMSAFQQNN